MIKHFPAQLLPFKNKPVWMDRVNFKAHKSRRRLPAYWAPLWNRISNAGLSSDVPSSCRISLITFPFGVSVILCRLIKQYVSTLSKHQTIELRDFRQEQSDRQVPLMGGICECCRASSYTWQVQHQEKNYPHQTTLISVYLNDCLLFFCLMSLSLSLKAGTEFSL